MSNLVEIAKDLEYVPDEQLIQLANGSDPRFPPFVVISEIKRRTDMRNRASEPMPRTTVAQEMVQEFAMPSRQGLEGMSQDATGILPPTVYNRDMPSSMMASGGSTNPKGYLFGGSVTAKGPVEPVYDEDGNLLEGIEALKASGKLRRFLNALMKEGGLTGYQTGNQTALTDTFIYGDNYETADGTCIRDYIHIEDLAQAHILSLKEGISGAFNLGNGTGFSVKEVIDVCRKITNHPIPVEIAKKRDGDAAILIADAAKAYDQLGWKPKYPELESIILSAWKWHQKNPNGYSDYED